MAQRPEEMQRQSRADGFMIAAATLAVVALVFAVADFVLASEAATNASDAKDAAKRASAARLAQPPSTAAPTPTAARPGTVRVTEQEFTIVADPSSAPAGKITFQVTNEGKIEHELVALLTDLDVKSLPVDLKTGTAAEQGAGIAKVGEVSNIKVGRTKSASFTLDPGHYLLVCNIPGHYQQGMATAFTVR